MNLKRIIANARRLVQESKTMKQVKLTKEQQFSVNKLLSLVNSEVEDLPLTPLLKNALKMTGEIKEDQQGVSRIKLDSPITEAEKQIISELLAIAKKHNNVEKYDYDKSLPASDPSHFDVDCWRNLRKVGREVTPGAGSRRLDNLEKYQIINDIDTIGFLEKDKDFQMAVQLQLEDSLSVNSLDGFVDASTPFSSKHTNVGYPFYGNARTIDPKTNKSYKDMSVDLAKITSLKQAETFPFVAFGRDQRGGLDIDNFSQDVKGFKDSKARNVMGSSRTANIIYNKVMVPLIEADKQTRMFLAYNNPDHQSKYYKKNLEILQTPEFSDWTIENFDFYQYDTSMSVGDLAIAGSLRSELIKDSKGKNISDSITRMGINGWLNYQTNKQMHLIGKIKSGQIDTNESGSRIGNYTCVTVLLKMVKDYLRFYRRFIALGGVPTASIGDDIYLLIPKNLDREKFARMVKELFGRVIHPDKGEYGMFFVQYRTIKSGKKFITTSPWPRGMSKCFWVERPKGLGPYGWVMANWQKIENYATMPGLFSDLVKMLCKYDNLKLGTAVSVQEFKQNLKNEDNQAVSKKRGEGSASKLYDGDPNKSHQVKLSQNGTVEWDTNYISRMHRIIKAALK